MTSHTAPFRFYRTKIILYDPICSVAIKPLTQCPKYSENRKLSSHQFRETPSNRFHGWIFFPSLLVVSTEFALSIIILFSFLFIHHYIVLICLSVLFYSTLCPPRVLLAESKHLQIPLKLLQRFSRKSVSDRVNFEFVKIGMDKYFSSCLLCDM